MTDTNTATAAHPLQGQPYEIVERDGVRFTLLGTAHVSRASVDAVRAAEGGRHSGPHERLR